MWNKLLNPWLVFTSVWIFVAIFIKLQITVNIGELKGPVWAIIWINLITSLYLFVFFLLIRNLKYKFDPRIFALQVGIAAKFAHKLFFTWIILVLIDVIYSKGFPLLWIFTDFNSDYTNLGIPSLRGIQHTLYLFVFTIYVLCIKFSKFKNLKTIVLLLAVYPILMLSRSLMMYALFQVMCSILFWSKINLRHLLTGVLSGIAVIFLFGILGDARGGNVNPFSYLISPFYADLMEKLPTGFTWVYVYLTANFNNIIITYGSYDLSYSLGDILYNLVPGILKSFLFSTKEPVLITDENLNVASFYAGYITSYGILGAILGGVLLQIIATKFYFLARSGNVGYLIGYSILFSCLIISVFFDALMTVSTVAQIALAIFLARHIEFQMKNYDR